MSARLTLRHPGRQAVRPIASIVTAVAAATVR